MALRTLGCTMLVTIGAMWSLASTASATVQLDGAPTAVLRVVASGKMPQPTATYAFAWSESCGAIRAFGCMVPGSRLTLDPELLGLGDDRIDTGIGEGVPILNYVLFHELGHVFDNEWMTAQARQAFLDAIGRPGDDWDSPADAAPPAELFADAYAVCSVYGAAIPRGLTSAVGYGWKPTAALQRAVCGLIRSVGSGSFGVASTSLESPV
jgi:hypothetical protein